MKFVIDIPEGMIDAFRHEYEWTPSLCADMNEILKRGAPLINIKPERKKGKWIFRSDCRECSECGNRIAYYDNAKFCEECGADMREQVLKYADNDTAFGGLQSAT